MSEMSVFSSLKDESRPAETTAEPPWLVLSVEDDTDYQATLAFALSGLEVAGRPVELITAQSATDAAKIIAKRKDIGVILLDVVMEDDDAGLRLVGAVRDFIGNASVRIVLLTGQPGMAPRKDVMSSYDIDDYWCKSEITSEQLVSVVTANLRTWKHLEDLRHAKESLLMVVSACKAISLPRDLHDFSSEVLRQIAKIIQTDQHGIVCVRRDTEDGCSNLEIAAATGVYSGLTGTTIGRLEDTLKAPEGLLQRIIQSGDALHEDDYSAFRFSDKGLGGQEYITIIKTPRRLLPNESALLQIFNENVGTGFTNVSLHNRVNQLAYTDTGIDCPNRNRLVLELANLTPTERAAHKLVIIQIDHTRDIVVSLGEAFYRNLMRGIYASLETLFPGSLVAHCNEAGFCILVQDRNRFDGVFFEDHFRHPLRVGDSEHMVTATTAIMRLGNFPGRQPEQLLSLLESRVTALRRRGERYAEVDQELEVSISAKYSLLSDLRKALREQQLIVWLQPKVKLTDRRMVGMEALVRWPRDDGSMVPPGQFLPLAETTGLIDQLDQQVLKLVCDAAQQLADCGIHVPISFNASPSAIARPGYFSNLLTTIRRSGVSPTQLDLEITENRTIQQFSDVASGMRELLDLGMGVSIDDFGTGYSSLSYITQLAATTLKVDKIFVDRMLESDRDRSLIRAIITLGKQFGFEVVVEGVETEDQSHALLQMGCEIAQGYLFARPMPMVQLIDWTKSVA
ncbi:MAG: EAL domain-containing protein [Chromatiaceae bacterium]|nr:EAL domain-containing protein [Chromatiaceae bacterium]MCP5313600.1 EAL domain-containing protein [Chromatiaceae bacterium]